MKSTNTQLVLQFEASLISIVSLYEVCAVDYSFRKLSISRTRQVDAYNSNNSPFDSPCNSLTYSSFYYFGLEQPANSWGSFELNSQMAPSLFQIHVLSTLTMSSFALEAREECRGHENPRFLK